MAELDFSFVTWQFVQDYLLKGLYFTLFLTSVATIGGIFFGTILALMRLSGTKFLEIPASVYINGMRSIPLVMVILWFFLLVPPSFYSMIGVPTTSRAGSVGHHHLHCVSGCLFCRNRAGRYSVHSARAGQCRFCAGYDLWPEHAARRFAAGFP